MLNLYMNDVVNKHRGELVHFSAKSLRLFFHQGIVLGLVRSGSDLCYISIWIRLVDGLDTGEIGMEGFLLALAGHSISAQYHRDSDTNYVDKTTNCSCM